jgi:hypothetical protein
MRASGAIGQSQIYADWKGIPYVRQYVIPSNPQTAPQVSVRAVFSYLNALYRQLGPIASAVWEQYAMGRAFIPRNGLIKQNLTALNLAADLADFIASPSVRSGPAMATFVPITGAGSAEIDWEITAGALPTGWTVTSAGVLALRDQDPHDAFLGEAVEDSVASPGPYTGTLTVGQAAADYAVCGWLVYERPDATIAISASGNTIVASGA